MPLTKFNGFIDINDHGLLLIKGVDATTFLQGQVTCDIDTLSFSDGQNRTNLGAHCTHKGRMLFSFRACRINNNTIALAMYKQLIPNALSTLKKYSIFSKVELIDASNDYQLLGVTGDNISLIEPLVPSLPDTQDDAITHLGLTVIRINHKRYECWVDKRSRENLLKESMITPNTNLWTALNIIDGIGEVRPETTEAFIPQMLNYQLIGHGISFKKGCYTGQEVVARMHYLGKLKRHMYRFSTNLHEVIAPGSPIFSPNSQQSIGQVVISAIVDGSQELLAVITKEALNHGEIYLQEGSQHKLEVLPLPYSVTQKEP